MKKQNKRKIKNKKVSSDAMEYTTSNSSSSGEPNPTPNDTTISISEMFEFVKGKIINLLYLLFC